MDLNIFKELNPLFITLLNFISLILMNLILLKTFMSYIFDLISNIFNSLSDSLVKKPKSLNAYNSNIFIPINEIICSIEFILSLFTLYKSSINGVSKSFFFHYFL